MLCVFSKQVFHQAAICGDRFSCVNFRVCCEFSVNRSFIKLQYRGDRFSCVIFHLGRLSFQLTGFPINLPYTELEPLVEAVFATGVHSNESNDVEFALAVHIHAYPSSVLSVWIYVASLMRKR